MTEKSARKYLCHSREDVSRFVILGNHRDAWTFGAVDLNSGRATLLVVLFLIEITCFACENADCTKARKTAENRVEAAKNNRLMQLGCGEIGSVEWVEENREMLAARVAAYLNVDCAVQGGPFRASAIPQLDDIIIEAAQKVQDPDNSSQTIYQSWLASDNDTTLGRLGGAGSDYAAFVQHIGTPALDMSFGNGYPVYHSMYDDFVWMKKFGDPMFHRHAAVASIWGLVALRLADDEVLPFNYLSYAIELQVSLNHNGISLVPLYASIEKLRKAAKKIRDDIKVQYERSLAKRRSASVREVRELNDRLIMTERTFIDRDGLSSRTWYKHLIYAPTRHNAYVSNSFPGISDAIERAKSLNTPDSWRSVQHEVWRVARASHKPH
ncbi:hypothetical protein BC332_20198 [Capsicum chinense]|nr:hypothetical protein BC332_20198 [Capsicum chinense]